MFHQTAAGGLLLTALVVSLSNCSSGLTNLSRRPDGSPVESRDWSPSGRDLQGYELGIRTIDCGPQVENLYDGRLIAASRDSIHPMNLRVSPARFSEPTVTIWDATGVEHFSQELPDGTHTVRISRDGQECLFGAAIGVLEWSRQDRTVQPLLKTEHAPLAISDNGQRVLVRDESDGQDLIRVLSLPDGRELGSMELAFCYSAQFVDDGRQLGLVGRSSEADSLEAFVWDYIANERTPGFGQGTWRAAFSADGARYAVVAEGNAVRVWDTRTGTMLYTTSEHSGDLWTMAFSPDGRYLASAGEGKQGPDNDVGEIRIWDAETGEEVTTIIDDTSWGVTALTFTPEGTELVSGNGDGVIRFWSVPHEP